MSGGTAVAVAAALERRLDPNSKAPIAVALSGGGDSLALLLLAAPWAHARGRPLLALTVDHGLNPDSARWTAFAQAVARKAGAGWAGLAWTGAKPGSGLPAAARAARHRLLAEAARAAGARVLLTGHTHDDVREADHMRGEDVPGLGHLRDWSPSPAWPEGRGLFLLRPLLGLSRAALRDWLTAAGHTWIEDPANEDVRFARSRARRAVAEQAFEEIQARPGPPPPAGERLAQATADGRLVLDRRGLLDGGRRLLAAALVCAAGTDRPPRGEQLERLLERLEGEAPVDATLAGARLIADRGAVQFGREAGERFRGGLSRLALARGSRAVWDGRFEMEASEPVEVAPLGGLMARLGRADRACVKGVPAWARGSLPALVDARGEVRLPRPLGDGAAFASSLAGARLTGTCDLIAREAQIDDAERGAFDPVTLSSAPIA